MEEPMYRIRARHDASTITVYQAYAPEIGLPAAERGSFPALWKRTRMTWVKPSFLWMMYRCGWGTKADQEVVLAIRVKRSGFDWALGNACLSRYSPAVHADRDAWKREMTRSPARVQWDPERDIRIGPLPYRSLQLGLSGEASRRFADEWIVGIDDVTSLAHRVHDRVRAGDGEAARALLPEEPPYSVDGGLPAHLCPHPADAHA